MELNWLVKQNGKLKAGFLTEADAREYASTIRVINRMAGYKDRYEVVDDGEREGERER